MLTHTIAKITGRPEGIGWVVAFLIGLSIAGMATITPVLPAAAREIVMNLFSSVCHQLPNRSPHLGGVQLAVCHRCIGIYYAFPVASILFRATRGAWPSKTHFAALLFFISVLPAGIDWFGDLVGWWVNTPASRVITGSILGIAAGYIFTKATQEIIDDLRSNSCQKAA
ncbi:MAG: hypothetical protein BMS9Abin05_2008 [Rhodothermia bacterium]|nr:MAG: hypothetical protein BMS9Abin05_2008 [Rhodothermia bacterium]